jgi:hypothetical protein
LPLKILSSVAGVIFLTGCLVIAALFVPFSAPFVSYYFISWLPPFVILATGVFVLAVAIWNVVYFFGKRARINRFGVESGLQDTNQRLESALATAQSEIQKSAVEQAKKIINASQELFQDRLFVTSAQARSRSVEVPTGYVETIGTGLAQVPNLVLQIGTNAYEKLS